MTRVLIVENSPASLQVVQHSLVQDGYEIKVMVDGPDMLRTVYHFRPHLIVLEAVPPGTSAWKTCRKLRGFYDALIMIVGALASEADIVRALDEGADEYVSAPSSAQELRARIRAYLRRPSARPGTGPLPYIDDDMTIDLKHRRIVKRGALVRLSPTEYELLACLVRHRGEVVAHHKLLSEALGREYRDDLDYLKVYMRRLREKLEDDPADPVYLLTHRSAGYSFNPASNPANPAH